MRWKLMCFVLCAVLWLPTQAQDAPTVVIGGDDVLGTYLVSGLGQPLYTFSIDLPNVSNCTGDCLGAWLPLSVTSPAALTADVGIVGELGVIERADTGTLQVTYNRQPLYTFVADTAGVATGDGAGALWFVARPQLIGLGGNEALGQFLTDAAGNTLYFFFNDVVEGASQCTGGCATNWPPLSVTNEAALYAGLGAVVAADLDLITREDLGVLQVRYQGRPLYTFAGDVAVGDANGQGLNEAWSIVRPPIMQITAAEPFGLIWAGNDGTTLYTLENDTAAGETLCGDGCTDTWRPHTVRADSDLDPVRAIFDGDFGTSPRPDGTLQVTRNGLRLYYYTGDAAPGDTNGDGLGGVWSVLTIGAPPADSVDPSGTQAPTSAPTEADMTLESMMCMVTAKTNANLRSGPGTIYARQGSFPANETREATGQANGSDGFVWYTLADGAWIRSDLVDTTGDCMSLPMVTPPPAPILPTAVPPTAIPPTMVPPTAPPMPTSPPPQPPTPATTEEP